MRCHGCARHVLRTWAVDGTEARLCLRCIVRAMREADQELLARRLRRIMGGWS